MYLTMEEETAYTWEMFLSDLGGIYGFTLGISIISILELFDFILLKLWKLWTERQRCRKKLPKKAAEAESIEEWEEAKTETTSYQRMVTPPPTYDEHIEFKAYSR